MNDIKWKKNQSLLSSLIEDKDFKYILVHSDAIKTIDFIDFQGDPLLNLRHHLNYLMSLSSEIIFPGFNYDFPTSRRLDFNKTAIETGSIPEYFMSNVKHKRTFDPMFSLMGTSLSSHHCNFQKEVNSFAESGPFNIFSKMGSGILLYGADFSSLTFIHYLEEYFKVPYRYEKVFKGTVNICGENLDFVYRSHFRPMGHYLDYDWSKIINDLKEREIFTSVTKYCHLIDCNKLYDFWCNRLKENNLYFLDNESLDWVSPMLNKLDRPFRSSDFE